MAIVASFATAANGCWIEEGNRAHPPQGDNLHPETRVFRFFKVDGKEFAEWAPLHDVQARGAGARWYGFGMGPVQPGDFILC